MIVLHAGAYNGNIAIWGEESYDNHTRDTPWWNNIIPDIFQKYPLSADNTTLNKILIDILSNNLKTAIRCSVSVWLPTRGSYPLPSSEIIAAPAPEESETKMIAWYVDAHILSVNDVIALLGQCINKRIITQGVIIGPDLAYWANVMRFAGFLVTRQQFLPGLKKEDKQFIARWNPVLSGRDTERLESLARRIPDVARSLSEHNLDESPKNIPTTLVKDIITMLVDCMVHENIFSSSYTQKKKFDSIHDAWLHALQSKDTTIQWNNSDLQDLETEVNNWQYPLTISADSPFRLCFRLEEPDETDNTIWFVRYLLQSRDDPSLIIPAQEIWNGQAVEALAKHGYPDSKEFLLMSLGHASGICKGISKGLQDPQLQGHTITIPGAYEFLATEANALEQAGYGIMLPSWWTSQKARAKLTARVHVKAPKMTSPAGLTLLSIMQFQWEIALGGASVTVEELEEIAQMKSSLVQVRGKWMEVSASEIKSAIKFLKKRNGKAQFMDIMRMSLGAEDTPGGIEVEGVNSTGKIAEVLQQLGNTTEIKDVDQPEKFVGSLRPYQVRGYSWLLFLRKWNLGGCLADDMGLGKTIQTLALIQRDWQKGDDPVLLICPTSVVENWYREAGRFVPDLPIMIHHGAQRLRGSRFKKEAQKHAVILSSYGLVQRDKKTFDNVCWNGIILDEAQNIKNSETKQSQAVRSLNSQYRLALTGTPVENNVGDLWSIMEFLNPGFLGTKEEFRKKFFVPIQTKQDKDVAERLKRATSPFILRRLKTDKSIISDLPNKTEEKIFCNLTEEQTSLYTSVLDECMDAVTNSENGIQRKGIILSTISKLKQVCNHPAHFLSDGSKIAGRSGKIDRLTEMLDEIVQSGYRALVFTQFAEMGQMLQYHLQEVFGFEVLFLHGAITRQRRTEMIERFQNDPNGPQIFILSLKAGGTGLNLTAASHVFHFDRWWNPAVEDQATDRVFRIGQKRNVWVHKFVCSGTLEEKIDAMIERKVSVARMVVGTGEKWITEMSDDDLKEMLSLGMPKGGKR